MMDSQSMGVKRSVGTSVLVCVRNPGLMQTGQAEANIKAERRKSAHRLTPQRIGAGALMPQFAGSRTGGAVYWGHAGVATHGGELLTPQHTGSGLVPQYTGSSRTLIPQHTGGNNRSLTMRSPLLSPVGYSLCGFGSPGGGGARLDAAVGGREGEDNDDAFVAEPAEVDVELLWVKEENEQARHSFPPESTRQTPDDSMDKFTPPSPNSAQDVPIPIEEAVPATPIVDSLPQDEVWLEESGVWGRGSARFACVGAWERAWWRRGGAVELALGARLWMGLRMRIRREDRGVYGAYGNGNANANANSTPENNTAPESKADMSTIPLFGSLNGMVHALPQTLTSAQAAHAHAQTPPVYERSSSGSKGKVMGKELKAEKQR
ncbi:hypothetical protein DFH08DRAFT_987102 [Mycena albidolilacea]|uniref:Uncharacterized protein n=1 Tax=Mycena albidolilacea TaxID=1033008 RepID=A0AAD7A9S6_9AGAR|nr:hypothetical protein DFH08DRAFT_987102 [Mycena albidolilacea]